MTDKRRELVVSGAALLLATVLLVVSYRLAVASMDASGPEFWFVLASVFTGIGSMISAVWSVVSFFMWSDAK